MRTDKLICDVLNSAPAPVLPELLAARHQAGLAIFDATGRYRPSDEPYLNYDNDPRGPWTSGDLSVKTYKAECDYPITTPSGRVVNPPPGLCWRLTREGAHLAPRKSIF